MAELAVQLAAAQQARAELEETRAVAEQQAEELRGELAAAKAAGTPQGNAAKEVVEVR